MISLTHEVITIGVKVSRSRTTFTSVDDMWVTDVSLSIFNISLRTVLCFGAPLRVLFDFRVHGSLLDVGITG